MSLGSGFSTRSWKLAEAFSFSPRISEPSAVLREYEFLYELRKKILFEREIKLGKKVMMMVLQHPNTSHQEVDVSVLTL